MHRPYLLGLTGNIACGKSLVLEELRRLGAATLDADAVVHQLLRRGEPTFDRVVAAFGEGILNSEGEIDRRALGAIVFRDPTALERLEKITHPAVLDFTWKWLAALNAEVAVVDAIKLFEAGIAGECDEVWAIACPREEQLRRLVENRHMTPEEAWTRILAQPPQEEKVARADVVIDNSGTPEETRARVGEAWEEMLARKGAGHAKAPRGTTKDKGLRTKDERPRTKSQIPSHRG